MIPNINPLKIWWLDIESTGTDPKKHALIEMSSIFEVNRNIVGSFVFRCQPGENDEIDPEAMKIHGLTEEYIRGRDIMVPKVAWSYMLAELVKHIKQYDKEDKFFIAGYNVGFDADFLYWFCKKLEFTYLGAYKAHSPILDVLKIAEYCVINGVIPKPGDMRLGTLCKMAGIQIEAHNSESDIGATRKLYYWLESRMRLHFSRQTKV